MQRLDASETGTESLLLRVDVSASVGAGHAMRCLALAQAWKQAGGTALLMGDVALPELRQRLRSEEVEFIPLQSRPGSPTDADQTVALARQTGASWVVVDGYHFGPDYQRATRASGTRLLLIDDIGGAGRFCADIVLNQNLHACEGLYPNREPYTRLLLGTRYALLRREFVKWKDWERPFPEVAHKVLVTLGGGDTPRVTFNIVEALKHLNVDRFEAIVVLGGNNANSRELQSIIRGSPIKLAANVANIVDLMAWADVAVTAGGNTCWECAFMGVPSLVVVLAENQVPVAEALTQAGAALSLGDHYRISSFQVAQQLTRLLKDSARRAEMSRWGRALVDGAGVARVLTYMGHDPINLRQVEQEDCRLLWGWASDPEVRAVSFVSESISWDSHVRWFKSRLSDPRTFLYIASNNWGVPIGQVRYDVEGNDAAVSISVDGRFRGQGYGSVMLRLGARRLFEVSDVSTIHAYVKEDNKRSRRIFLKAGFGDIGTINIKGHHAIHLVLRRGKLKGGAS